MRLLALAVVLVGGPLAMATPAAAQATRPRAVTVTVDPNTTYQTMTGFGTCYIDWGRPPKEYSDPAFLDKITHDLGMSIVRQQMADEIGSEDAIAPDGTIDFTKFKIGPVGDIPGFAWRQEFLVELKKRGVKQFLMTPWTPPAWMKTNHAARHGGYLRADMRDAFASYLAASIMLAKHNYGLDINAVTLQNELLFIEPYHSCVYNPWQLRETVRATMHAFAREHIHTQIFMPEDMMIFDRMWDYIAPTMRDPETAKFDGGFATHRQQGWDDVKRFADAAAAFHKPIWMTETSGHQQTWDGALQMGVDMYDYLVGGNQAAWMYWQITDSPRSGVYTLMTDGQETAKYAVAKQFYRFIRPGAVRMGATSTDKDVLVAAFFNMPTSVSKDDHTTVVLINRADAPAHVSLRLEKVPQPGTADLTRVQQGMWRPLHLVGFRSTAGADCVRLQGYVTDSVDLPARSITTLDEPTALVGANIKFLDHPFESWHDTSATTQPWGDSAPQDPGPGAGICDAALNNNVRALERDIKAGLTNTPRADGWTALHCAIQGGGIEAVDALLAAGANVNAVGKDGWTPLHVAAATFEGTSRDRTKHVTKYDVFKRILAAHPNIQARTKDGWTPLHAAVINAYTAWRQSDADSLNRIRDLLAAGCDLEARDMHGRTPLIWAAWQGFTDMLVVKPDVVQLLIDKGAKLNAADDRGRTALHYAADMGYEPIVYALIHAGANKALKDKDGHTARDLALAHADMGVVRILDTGAMPAPPATQAAHRGTGKLGPELMQAAWSGDTSRVEQLLKLGADLYYTDSDGFRPIDRARDNGHTQVVALLKAAETAR